MSKCRACGATVKEVAVEYHVENLSGVLVGLVNSVTKASCESCGEEFVTIPDVEGLISAAAVCRAMIPIRLNGAEIRFLRKSIDMSAKEMAGILDVRPETVSRWENDREPMPVASEKVLRLGVGSWVKEANGDRAPAVDYDEQAVLAMTINPLRAVSDKPLMNFSRTNVKVEKKKQLAWDEVQKAA